MKPTSAVPDATFTLPQQRLLGGWRDILDDVRDLSRSLLVIPEECRRGDPTAPSAGPCTCCSTVDGDKTPSCPDCTARLLDTRSRVDLLVVDTLRFFPAFAHILVATVAPGIQGDAQNVQDEIAALVRAFERADVAAEAFRSGCRASHLATVKQAARDLREHAERLERML